MFGVKLIEAIQRVFSWCGYPLLVDAENWMAHRGAANVILNIFRHSRTPGNYVILSGDVHYSFVYEILIRHRSGSPHIWQITSSGIKNEFPRRLLDTFDRLNRWLYSPRSPLNWFTKRRLMKVIPRTPEHSKAGERLWNSAVSVRYFSMTKASRHGSTSSMPMVTRLLVSSNRRNTETNGPVTIAVFWKTTGKQGIVTAKLIGDCRVDSCYQSGLRHALASIISWRAPP